MHKPFTKVPSLEGNILLFPFRLHMHIRVPTKPTIWKDIEITKTIHIQPFNRPKRFNPLKHLLATETKDEISK